MWISERVLDLFSFNRDLVNDLRNENLALNRERAAINANAEWLRLRVNALEMERAFLLEKALGIKLPIPEIVATQATKRPSNFMSEFSFNGFDFSEEGNELAKQHGIG